MSEATKIKRALVVVSLVVVALAAAPAQGDILNFVPEPESDAIPEFSWDGATFSEGAGAIGTGYNQAGPGDTTKAPGLTMIVPFEIPGIPGSIVGSGSTTFYDATLDIITPLPANGAAFIIGPMVVQQLGSGEFKLYSTDPAETSGDDENPILLLSGIIHSADITGILGSITGAVLNAYTTYTGGVVADAISSGDFNGSFTWTLLDIIPPLTISTSPEGYLEAFDANGTGHFTPEPATMVLLGVGSVLMTLRRRRNRV